jgi:hypothetical protein
LRVRVEIGWEKVTPESLEGVEAYWPALGVRGDGVLTILSPSWGDSVGRARMV